MITLKNEIFNTPGFMQAVYALSEKQLPVKISWNIGRVYKECIKFENKLKEEVKTLSDLYFEKDEQGNPKQKDGKFVEKVENGNEKFKESFEKLLQKEIEIKGHFFVLDDLKDIEMKPYEMSLLAPLISE